MAIIMSHPMTSQEIRVLQEFRRVGAESLSLASIKAIKHPTGGGDAPAVALIGKGYLTAEAGTENFVLTGKAKDFLALEVKPEIEETGSSDSVAE